MNFPACLLVLAALAACSDGTGPAGPSEGTLRFGYQGEIQGSFDVTGFNAFARPTLQGDRLGIAGMRTRDGVRDMLTITIPYPRKLGTYVPELPSDFAYGIPAGGVPEFNFSLASAEVVVTELSDGRIRGQFTGQGEDFSQLPEPTVRRVEIIGGTFDLPVLRR